MMFKKISTYALVLFLALSVAVLSAAQIRWLAIGDLHNWFSSAGSEVEVGRTGATSDQLDGMRYPGLYPAQDVQACKGIWLGCKNYADPTDGGKNYANKVINCGPRLVDESNAMMSQTFELVAKRPATTVMVDGAQGKFIGNYDNVDRVDPDLDCDREINSVIRTSLGIKMTRKVKAFTNQFHQAYFIFEYTFENDGKYNQAGDTHSLTIDDFYVYLQYRLAVNREATTYELGILEQASTWGMNTMNHNFGRNGNWGPGVEETINIHGTDVTYDVPFRGFYVWQGSNESKAQSEAADFGAPYDKEDKRLTSVAFPGAVVIHADASTTDDTDDPMQPVVNSGIASDHPICTSKDQYDPTKMTERYQYMNGTHSEIQDWLAKSPAQYAIDQNVVPLDNIAWPWIGGGGISAAMGFGPYDLDPGESFKIVMAEAVGSLDMDTRREIGAAYDAEDLSVKEKNDYVRSSRDSLFQAFQRAIDNYQSGYSIPAPPDAPSEFYVLPQGDRITLKWKRNSEEGNFKGYRLYRALSEYDSVYHLILDTSNPDDYASDDAGYCEFGDKSAVRGFDYYYYIEAYDDGMVDDQGRELVSSKYETLTNISAQLKRPPGRALEEVRIVPNPYHVRAKSYQFGTAGAQKDRIMFYNIPPQCNIKVYSERGDLVWEKDHTNNSGDEAWNSITSSRQVIVSGVYIAVIKVLEDYVDENTGEIYFRTGEQIVKKFVIVR